MNDDADRFRFIEDNRVSCGIRGNGYWFAHGDVWVSRETLAECIDILAQRAPDSAAGGA